MIKVLIADDHVVVRNGLRQLFEYMGDASVAKEVTNGKDVLEALKQGQFDLLILDLTMPGLSGINLIERIRLTDTKLPILVLSMHDELLIVKRVLKAGATGFITKGSEQDILITAIRKVAAGGRFVDQIISDQMMFEKPVQGELAPHERLSERELHVMKLYAKGWGVNDIASELYISSKTVSSHKARVMHKMNFQSNAELVRYSVDNGLFE
jgi:DNA-binding NarL/FixJ family response regulator